MGETRRLYLPNAGVSSEYPVHNIGYEEVGRVVETGSAVTDVPLGTLVFGTWWHRTHYIATADWVRPRRMPAGADPRFGIFSHIGAVALNGVHDGRIRIGETVAVFGLGTVGQYVPSSRILRHSTAPSSSLSCWTKSRMTWYKR